MNIEDTKNNQEIPDYIKNIYKMLLKYKWTVEHAINVSHFLSGISMPDYETLKFLDKYRTDK